MFNIVGERLNTSRRRVREAVAARDADYIQEDARLQARAGAVYLDVNAGEGPGDEFENLKWLIGTVEAAVDLPLSLDSPDPAVIGKALGLTKKPPLVNSISLESSRFEPMLAYLAGADADVAALCMDDTGMPKTKDEVVARAGRLIEALTSRGVPIERIHVDPLIQPISTDVAKGRMAMETVREIMATFAGAHTICGLSNVSYGLPKRRLVNRTFLTLLMAAGLDGAIVDPLDEKIMANVLVAEMLLGRDDYCLGYLKAMRAGRLDFEP